PGARFRKVQDGLNTPAHPARSLGLGRPDGLEHPEYQRGVDRLYRQRPDDRLGVGRKRRFPLRRVLAVAPAGPVRVDVAVSTLLESDCLSRIEPGFGAAQSARLDWIHAVIAQSSGIERLGARFLQAE